MELHEYVRVIRSQWIGVAFVVLFTMALAVAYVFLQPKVYAADASGLVSAGATEDSALASVKDELAKSRAVSYADIAASRATAQRVVEALELDDDPETLVTQIDVENPVDTVLVRITARASTARDAQVLADAWVEALASRVAEVENPRGAKRAGLRVVPIESAALSTEPISPRPVLDLAIGLVLGLLLGAAYAIVRNLLDRRLRTPEDVAGRFDINVVAEVPMFRVAGSHQRVQFALDPKGTSSHRGAGEAFRKLRSNLTYRYVGDPPRVIVVTSPKAGDGKSTVSINLAAAIAATGEPVVLVDADLRGPSVAESLGLVEGVGLTDVLVGGSPLAQALQELHACDDLKVLGAGRVPPNPSELLGSKAMGAVLDELGRSAMVIVDAPPLLPVTDAAVLTARSDGALVVISAGRTAEQDLGAALAQLEGVNGRALGVIINRTSRGYYAGHSSSHQSDEVGRRPVDGQLEERPEPSERPGAEHL
jgi:capsular exopolysaccharide synthesis family protein